MTRIVADTERGNDPSQKVLTKAGFTPTRQTSESIWFELRL